MAPLFPPYSPQVGPELVSRACVVAIFHLAGLCLALPFLAWLFDHFLVGFWLMFGRLLVDFWGLGLACLVLSLVGFSWLVLASLGLSFLVFSLLFLGLSEVENVSFVSVFTVFCACSHFWKSLP